MKKIPKLRFPEFSGEWEEKELGNISQLTSSKRVYLSDYVNKGIPFYRGKEITDLKKGNKIDDILYITSESYNNFKNKYGVPQKGDILITAVGTLGNVYMIPNNEPFYFKDGNLIWMKEISELPEFLEYNLEFGKNKILDSAIGSTQKALTIISLNKIKFNFPSLPEQEEIASFLSSVDSKIEKLERKKELWEQYKKGMMQKIFSQELRFRDENGEDYPEWEEKKICEITLKLYQGINTAADKVEYSEEGIPILQAKHITSGKLTFEDTKYLNIDRYSEYTKNYIPEENEILFSNIGTIGKSVLIKQKESFLIAWNILKITLNLSKIYPSYFLQTLKFFDYRKVFSQLETGNATKFINKGDFENIPINLPSLPEQTQIADFLTSLDSKIEVVEKELAGMKEFKKGLLQKMFV